ncbi:unnamed protein product [Spodoptera exigua]|nr:unnamed protein product [Spodoptera exigua]
MSIRALTHERHVLNGRCNCNRRRASEASVDASTAAVDISILKINDSRRLLSSTGSTYKTADAAHYNCSRRRALAAAVDAEKARMLLKRVRPELVSFQCRKSLRNSVECQ